jgi:hypothetical protein
MFAGVQGGVEGVEGFRGNNKLASSRLWNRVPKVENNIGRVGEKLRTVESS